MLDVRNLDLQFAAKLGLLFQMQMLSNVNNCNNMLNKYWIPCASVIARKKFVVPISEVTPKSQTNNFLGSLNVDILFL